MIVANHENNDFLDPLRGWCANVAVSNEDSPDIDYASAATSSASLSSGTVSEIPSKEWTSFKRFLMQKFPVSKMISVSSVSDFVLLCSEFVF